MPTWEPDFVSALDELGLRGELIEGGVLVLQADKVLVRHTSEREAYDWLDAQRAKRRAQQRGRKSMRVGRLL